ncbi:MAG TPA: hypothetical protein VJ697_03615 [Nitrososphaeraceae archaeon]|nr:hypothetical protein [Nitrososphaeraceae archaeon]
MKPELFPSNTTNTFEESGSEDTEYSLINKKDNLNQQSKSCCCSLFKMDQSLKNMQKMWSMID